MTTGIKGTLPIFERSRINLEIAKMQGLRELDGAFKLLNTLVGNTVRAGLYTRLLKSETLNIEGRVGGMASCQGVRKTMEDAALAQSILLKKQPSEIYAIFDGHGGDEVAKRVQERIASLMAESFTSLDDEQIWKTLKKEIFQKLNAECGEGSAGTTAAVALIVKGKLWVANVGDSRIIFNATQLTEDAKPDIPRYMRKIVKAGGHENCTLTVARAIGDHDYVGVSAVPKISYLPLEELGDGYLILASDGLYEKASSRQIGAAVEQMDLEGNTCETMAKRLVASAIESGARDNISAIVIKC